MELLCVLALNTEDAIAEIRRSGRTRCTWRPGQGAVLLERNNQIFGVGSFDRTCAFDPDVESMLRRTPQKSFSTASARF